MPKVSLVPYMVRVHRRGQARTFERIDAFDGHTSLYDVFCGVSRALQAEDARIDDQRERALLLDSFDKADDMERVWGTARGGPYGYEADLYDVVTGAESHRSRDQAELVPLYFVAALDGSRDFGVVLFQRFGNHGITGHFNWLLTEWFAEHHPQYLVTLRHIVPESVLDELMDGSLVQAIHFVRFEVPSDYFDGLGGAGLDQLPGKVDVKVRVKGGMPGVRSRVRQWFRNPNRPPVRGLIELQGELSDFDYDTITVEMGPPGATKTVDLGRLGSLRATFNIDREVEKTAGGHPTAESIHRVARTYVEQVLATFSPGG